MTHTTINATGTSKDEFERYLLSETHPYFTTNMQQNIVDLKDSIFMLGQDADSKEFSTSTVEIFYAKPAYFRNIRSNTFMMDNNV